jgi:tetratricopeptide (TPR) repeat protein
LDVARALHDPAATALVLWNLLLIKHFAGHPEEAAAFGEEALAIARELNLRERLAYTLNDIVRPYVFMGQTDKARAASQEAETLWRELNNLPMLADNLTNAATYAFLSADYRTGMEKAREALEVSEQISNAWGQAYASSMLGVMYFTLGELANALELLTRGIELGIQAHFMDAIENGYLFSSLLYRLVGQRERAIEMLEHALAAGGASEPWTLGLHSAAALLYAEVGDTTKARQSLASAKKAFSGNLDSPSPFIMSFAEVALALAEKRPIEAEELALELLRRLDTGRIRPFMAMGGLSLAQAQAQLGNLRGALGTLELARAEAQEAQSRSIELDILVELGRVAEALGDREMARERRREALETTRYLAERAPSDLRESFLNRPEVKAPAGSELLSENEQGSLS